jgi:histidine kinase-like protein
MALTDDGSRSWDGTGRGPSLSTSAENIYNKPICEMFSRGTGWMLTIQNHPDAPLFIVASGISAVLAAFAWRRRTLPTAPAFIAMMLGQTAWSLGSGLELFFSDLPTKLLCLDLMNVGVAFTPPSLLFLYFTSQVATAGSHAEILRSSLPFQ